MQFTQWGSCYSALCKRTGINTGFLPLSQILSHLIHKWHAKLRGRVYSTRTEEHLPSRRPLQQFSDACRQPVYVAQKQRSIPGRLSAEAVSPLWSLQPFPPSRFKRWHWFSIHRGFSSFSFSPSSMFEPQTLQSAYMLQSVQDISNWSHQRTRWRLWRAKIQELRPHGLAGRLIGSQIWWL